MVSPFVLIESTAQILWHPVPLRFYRDLGVRQKSTENEMAIFQRLSSYTRAAGCRLETAFFLRTQRSRGILESISRPYGLILGAFDDTSSVPWLICH